MGIELLFLKVLNMSINAGYVAVVVLLLRMILHKAPKKYSYLLWGIVFLRLLMPFTVQSNFSLIPFQSEQMLPEHLQMINYKEVPTDILYNSEYILGENNSIDITQDIPIKSEINSYEDSNEGFYDKEQVTEPQTTTTLGLKYDIAAIFTKEKVYRYAAYLWILVTIILVLRSFANILRLKWRLRTATLVAPPQERIYETDQFEGPFLYGFISPRIYLPVGLSEQDKVHVIKHEQIHRRRRDYLVKTIAYYTVLIHWFNPIAWLSFYLFQKDMEMSCDELVIRNTTEDIRISYSKALLSLSKKQSGLLSPLAFGETNTKSRIKNILNLKNPSTWLALVSLFIIAAAAITLLTNTKPIQDNTPGDNQNTETTEQMALTTELANLLHKNRTPYIGNNSKVAALIHSLPVPEGLRYKSIELKTTEEPYELHVYYLYNTSSNTSTINNEIEFHNAVLLFATIENMSIYTIHRLFDGGESTLTYTRDSIEKEFGNNLYHLSEDPETLVHLMNTLNGYKKASSNVTYEIEVIKNTLESKEGVTLAVISYEKPILKGDSLSIKKINQSINDAANVFFTKKEGLFDYAQSGYAANGYERFKEEPYRYTSVSELSYNNSDMMSFKMTTNWWAGGVWNIDYNGLTFDMKSGELLKLEDIFQKSPSETKDLILNATKEYIRDHEDIGWADDVNEIIEKKDLSYFKYYINKGNVCIIYDTYELAAGAYGAQIIEIEVIQQ